MKNSIPQLFYVLVAGLAAAGLTACASPGSRVASQTSLKTRTLDHGDSVCVIGTVRRPLGQKLPPGAHVDIELLDASGRVVARRQDQIAATHPLIEHRRSGWYSYAVCLPRPEQAGWTVRVSYHADAHS
jgi:hypothetical protein